MAVKANLGWRGWGLVLDGVVVVVLGVTLGATLIEVLTSHMVCAQSSTLGVHVPIFDLGRRNSSPKCV